MISFVLWFMVVTAVCVGLAVIVSGLWWLIGLLWWVSDHIGEWLDRLIELTI